jgi:hypothetical protein
MKKIALTQGKYALVDDADFEYLNQFKWCINNSGYAVRRTGGRKAKLTIMHRVLMGAQDGQEVDHANRDKLDNRMSNLRFVTRAQNIANTPLNRRNISGLKGVSWNKAKGKWQVRIGFMGNTISLGYHHDKIEAAKRYNNKALELYGEHAWLNPLEGGI